MAEAQEKKDRLVFKGVTVKFSEALAKLLVQSEIGFYTRPNSTGQFALLCMMNEPDVTKTLKNPQNDPPWTKAEALNLDNPDDIDNKKEALMIGDKIKLLVAKSANIALTKGNLGKNDGAAIAELKNNEYLLCLKSELDGGKDPNKIPITKAADSKIFTVQEMVEEKLEKMKN